MKLHVLAALFAALLTAAHAHTQPELKRHANLKRQATSSSSTSSAASSSSSASTTAATSAVTGSSSSSTGTVTGSSVSGSVSTTAAAAANSGVAATILTESATVSGVPALTALTFGMSSGTSFAATTTWATTASPPLSGAPSLPTPCKSRASRLLLPIAHSSPVVYTAGVWPTQDKVAPTGAFFLVPLFSSFVDLYQIPTKYKHG